LSFVVHLLQDGSNQYAAFNDFRPHFWSDFRFTKPLNVCSELGYTEVVHFLLQNGADPNMNDNGVTALIAASYAHLDIVHILLQSGAQVDTVALNQASTERRWDIVQALLQKSSFSVLREWIADGLEFALEDGRLEIVQLFLEAWTNVGGTQFPLHQLMVTASEWGESNIVRLLLEHGVDVNAATKNYNALCGASFHGHVEVIQILLENGAEVNAAGGRYGSALQAASANGEVAAVLLLLEKGADVKTFGGSALKAAARLSRLYGGNSWEAEQITCILLEHGAHEEDMTDYGSEEDVDTDDEGAMADSSSDDASSSESDN
jgi:hypothetical protein